MCDSKETYCGDCGREITKIPCPYCMQKGKVEKKDAEPVCKKCWSRGQIDDNCLDCKGSGIEKESKPSSAILTAEDIINIYRGIPSLVPDKFVGKERLKFKRERFIPLSKLQALKRKYETELWKAQQTYKDIPANQFIFNELKAKLEVLEEMMR